MAIFLGKDVLILSRHRASEVSTALQTALMLKIWHAGSHSYIS